RIARTVGLLSLLGPAGCLGPTGAGGMGRGPSAVDAGPPVRAGVTAQVEFPDHLEPPDDATAERILEAVADLWSQDLQVCTEAGMRLMEMGEVAVPYLGYFGPAQKRLRPGRRVRPSALLLPRLLRRVSDEHLAAALRSPYPSVRAAAAAVAGETGRRGMVEPLLEALDDPEPAVRRASVAALRRITKRFHGYRPGDPPQKRAPAVARWRAWWGRSKDGEGT
ncbi:MAG: HEAT repeat domain-containing protein, partial [Planctomycetota bacterium]